MSKPRGTIHLIVAALLVFVASYAARAQPVKVGITQIVEHPALDAARQGFIDRMAELGYEPGMDIVYDIQSAQGDQGTALTIA